MKKIILGLGLLLVSVFAHSQGLQNVIVEKYYVSTVNDSLAADADAATAGQPAGRLPVGSVTYRIYADLQPGYTWQASYGNASHSLIFTTSTSFYNNPNDGFKNPPTAKANIKNKVRALDSWFSSGAVCNGNFGILKSSDDGVANNVTVASNPDGVLLNSSPIVGIPLTTQDGMIAGTIPAPVDIIGLGGAESVFNDGSVVGNSFVVTGGSVYVFGGSSGPVPATNQVLIAQITTNGVFHYELNLQVGTPTPGVSENFVASAPTGAELTNPTLSGTIAPDVPPTVSITSPVSPANFITGATVNIAGTYGDTDGSVTGIQLLIDGVPVGSASLSLGSFTGSWIATTGTHHLTAVATDNDGGQGTSNDVTLIVAPAHLPYGVVRTTNTCYPATFCLPVAAQDAVSNVIGYDLVMDYDQTKVSPTGVITVSSDLVQASYVDVAYTNDAVNGLMNISLYFNTSAPASTRFQGLGNLMCVEFAKLPAFLAADSANFTVPTLNESYISGVQVKGVDPGKYVTHKDSTLNGSLKFWSDNSAIVFDSIHPFNHLVTNIWGNNAACNSRSAAVIHPDSIGQFHYNYANGVDVEINKDIAGSTDVQPVINGFDAYLTRKVIVNDLSFIPNIFQALAMDVNRDGFISAGDLSQINERAVLMIPEFKQSWNYDNNGVPIPGTGPSKDWVFVDVPRLVTPSYAVSATYPGDDGIGFSKSRVPQVPFCLTVPISGSTGCQLATPETYKGILVGDINGNYATAVPNNLFRLSANDKVKVVFDLTKAVAKNGYIDIPVTAIADFNVNALDFSINYNGASLSFESVVSTASNVQALAHNDASANIVKFTSNSLQNYETSKAITTVRFALNGAQLTPSDLNSIEAYLNGERVNAELRTAQTSGSNVSMVNVYPNPANGIMNVVVGDNAIVELLDLSGRDVIMQSNATANQKVEINTSGIANGIYMLKVYNESFVSTQKVVIAR